MAITGTSGGETIVDTVGNTHISALGGYDLIIAADEFVWELIDGGDGIDTVSYVNLYGVGVDIGEVKDGDGYCADTLDALRSIENVIGSSGADRLRGGAGGNELFGLGGDDLFEGRGGADKLSGGDGFDTATYERAGSAVTINLGTGAGFGGEAAGDTLFGIERVVGSAHADNLYGDAGRNTLEGGGGADFLQGADGNDALIGGRGVDWLTGGRGAGARLSRRRRRDRRGERERRGGRRDGVHRRRHHDAGRERLHALTPDGVARRARLAADREDRGGGVDNASRGGTPRSGRSASSE